MSAPKFENWPGSDHVRRAPEGHGEIVFPSGRVAKFDWDYVQLILAYRWHILTIGRTAYLRARVNIAGRVQLKGFHQLVLDCPQGMVRDHINRDGLDNRLVNLRACSKSENAINADGHRDAAVKAAGVYFHRQRRKYVACFRGRYLGIFPTVDEAVRARTSAIEAMRLVDRGAA